MYRTAVAILGREADAEEAAQDAFVSVWRALPMLRDVERFDAWLGRIVVNACRMALRRRRAIHEIALDAIGDPRDESGSDPDPAEVAATADTFDRAFERLSVDERALLLFAYRDALPLAEIGARLGVPVGTIKSRLSRARRALDGALAAEEPA